MPKIERKTQKIFGGNAESDQLAVFGSMITGTPVYNDDVETLQSEAYTEGWQVAVAANEAPFMEEMNGVQYGFSKQLAYLFQQGIAEWDAGTTYYLNSFCQVGGVIYKSMQDENINHSPADDTEGTYWTPLETGSGGGSGLEVCDIGMALYIDETKGLRRWLNGQIVTINANTQGFLTKLQSIIALHPSLSCTEEEWQSIKSASAVGQVGKFVLNYNSELVTEIVSVRIPAVVNVQGLLDLQNLGVTVAAGLPNIEGQIGSSQTAGILSDQGGTSYRNNSGAFTAGDSWANFPDIGTWPGKKLKIDASLSNPIYGNSTTVQPEAVQYPYFIQIATGQETEVNITNEIELNNPFFFGMSQYFDTEPNNLSWLKSDGEYKPKAVYPDYYNWILTNVNNGVKGFKGTGYAYSTSGVTYTYWITSTVPAVGQTVYGYNPTRAIGTIESLVSNGFVFTDDTSTQRTVTRNSTNDYQITNTTNWITDYDFVINTTNETFRLPLKNGLEGMFAGQAVVGNGITLGLTDGVNNASLLRFDNSGASVWGVDCLTVGYGKDVGYNNYSGSHPTNNSFLGVTTDPVKSGLVTSNSVPDGFALYYYVGETVQNANLIDAGRFGELVSTKANVDLSNCTRPYVTETYANGTSWYRVYSDGFCIQGGVNTPAQSTTSLTIQLLKTLKDTVTGVSAQISQYNEISAGTHTSFKVYVQTTSTITIAWTEAGYPSLSWLVTGYLPD